MSPYSLGFACRRGGRPMIVACGEALMDFVPARTAAGERAYLPRPGGSPFNVAVTVGRLGFAAGFAGGVSTDVFGERIVDALRASGVDTAYCVRLDRPTALAFVAGTVAEPEYAFFDRDAAYRAWTAERELPGDVMLLHFGSIALIDAPAADDLHALMSRERGRRVVTLDPNIRAAAARANESAYRARLTAMLELADVVKVSSVDLAWLAPGRAPADVAARWLAGGTSLVVVTAGAAGSVAYARGGRSISASAQPVQLVDTVGAGDSFMGALLAGLVRCDVATPAALATIDDATIGAVLRFASSVAAITCSRAGADPPWRDEVTLPAPVGRAKGTSR